MSGQLTATDVARTVLAGIAPSELDQFDLVAAAYRAAPQAARRANRAGNQPTAAAPLLAAEAVSTLTLAVGAELAHEMLVRSGTERRGFRLFRRRSASVESVAVPLSEDAIPELRSMARRLCLDRGVGEGEAGAVAAAFAAAWPRATKA